MNGKKIVLLSGVILLGIVIGVTIFVLRRPPSSDGSLSNTQETQLPNTNSGDTLWSSFESYQPLTLSTSLAITPSADFDSGTFCRFYYDETREQFFATFGTGQNTPGTDPSYIGGGEGGQGAAYLYLSTDLQPTGESGYYRYGGGDLATNLVGQYLYDLSGAPGGSGNNWRISQYDIRTWKTVGSVEIELDSNEGANDQMLAYANDQLIASSLYGDNAHGADTSGVKQDPTIGVYTHHHAVTTDLELVDSWVLDDVLHANGSSMVFVDGVYQFVTTTAYFGDLMVLQYDADWNYLGSTMLLANAQWPQGTVYDPNSERYYVAYLAIKGGGQSEARLAAFDKDWELLSNTVVTEYGNTLFAGRPSVLLHDGLLYMTYDQESQNQQTKERNKDWQCQLSVYEL